MLEYIYWINNKIQLICSTSIFAEYLKANKF